MNDNNLTDRELIHAVDNDAKATPRERELVERLMASLMREARRDTVRQGLGLPSREERI